MKTYRFEDGKYEFDRDDSGLLSAARRNGEPWRTGMESFQYSKAFHAALNRIDQLEAPINMVLHCPACGLQHVDRDESPSDREWSAQSAGDRERQYWTNPPHRSHLCHGCSHVWRPADVPTNGVRVVGTVGRNDSPIVTARALNEDAERSKFEIAITALVATVRSVGLEMGNDNGAPATRKALCWRQPDGRYGIKDVESAWWGWREALGIPMAIKVMR